MASKPHFNQGLIDGKNTLFCFFAKSVLSFIWSVIILQDNIHRGGTSHLPIIGLGDGSELFWHFIQLWYVHVIFRLDHRILCRNRFFLRYRSGGSTESGGKRLLLMVTTSHHLPRPPNQWLSSHSSSKGQHLYIFNYSLKKILQCGTAPVTSYSALCTSDSKTPAAVNSSP